jgi:hypothetical protein
MSAMADLASLGARFQREQAQLEATRVELHACIVASIEAGVRQVDIVKATGYTRERLRQLAKEAQAR